MALLATTVVLGILLFMAMYWGFHTGLRLGMLTAKGQVPAQIGKPQLLSKSKQLEESELLRGFSNMMDYTGEPKKGV